MPELPEVETVRRSLLPRVRGRRLGAVRVREPRLRYPVNVPALRRRLPGRKILGIRRRAKYLLFDLDDGGVLLVHLGMTGWLGMARSGSPPEPHDHVRIDLGGDQLVFNDVRRFGWVDAILPGAEEQHPRLRHLGVDPLDGAFTPLEMRRRARGRRLPIKNFLMDGRIVVGIGNIYACEALFSAGIHPTRPAGSLSTLRWRKLTSAVQRVLRSAIRQGGTTLRDFTDADGERGLFAIRLRVYDREGEACRRCRRPVRRIVQSGRSTFYCPGCQH